MSVLNLKQLLKPRSVALIGASDNPASLGFVVMKNLLDGHFNGPVWPVNPKYTRVLEQECYAEVAVLPAAPDLAVICTPAGTVPGIITQLGETGTRAAIVLSAGLRVKREGKNLEQRMLEAAQPHGLRILGPNCVGLQLPNLGLNASFAHRDSLPGKLAMISQSGALCTMIIDWARSRGIGFSHFISLGNAADVDFGDLLDYLGSDAGTRGILLYMESLREARKFMSAARATARNKPVIVIKSGREREGARAANSHTGALAGSDEVFDTAIRRAGMLRVYTIEELFSAVETLARARRVQGNRLAMLTNGGGPGVLATDALVSGGGRLAELSEATVAELNRVLPPEWSHGNPVDIVGDGDARRYLDALRALLRDKHHDAVLIMLVPTAVVDNTEVARVLAEEIKETKKPILTCWMGEEAVEEARDHFEREGIPSYETPESAIHAFLQMVQYEQNQTALMQTPASIPGSFTPDHEAAKQVLAGAAADGRGMLTEPEAKAVLRAYGIPVVDTYTAADVDEAERIAEDIGYPVALKILSPDITHKSDVGGVLLNIESTQLLRYAAEGMLARIQRHQPGARIQGFSVQKMAERPGAYELIIGAATDPIFGPVLLFGRGGTAVEVVADKAVSLPPLNTNLADDLMQRTLIYRELRGYRDRPAVDLAAVRQVLLKVSQLLIDYPEVQEVDINPLFADPRGVLALDARLHIAAPAQAGTARLAIRPYPQELEEWITLGDNEKVLLRPIRPEDEPAHHELFQRLSKGDVYFRFFRAINDLDHRQLARYTQIDYDREMAFIATTAGEHPETLGVVRAVADADNDTAEFAIVIRSDRQSIGLGRRLMEKLIRYCREHGTRRLVGETLMENQAMIRLARRFGFAVSFKEGEFVDLSLDLQSGQGAGDPA
jgi:acetyltransferase